MIAEFMSRLGAEGLAKPTMFMVEVRRIPATMGRVEGVLHVQDGMRFYAETAELPGAQLLTTDHRHYDMSSKYAYGKVVDDLNITFRVDKEFLVKKFLDAWIDSVYNRNTGNLNYKNNYVGTIQVSQLSEDGRCYYSVELEDAFPVSVQPMALAWDLKGSYHRVSATFNYVRWTVKLGEAFFQPPNYQTSTKTANLTLDVYENQISRGFNQINAKDLQQIMVGGQSQIVSRATSSISNLFSSAIGSFSL